jgi:hypothetical protein
MITKVLIILAIVVAVFLIVAAVQKPEFTVVRSTTISAPPAVPFSYVNDLHKWQEISPYAKMDAAAKYTFEGPPAGVGSSMTWAGNSQVGEGTMTITESRPNELVRMNLAFKKPFESIGLVAFTFKAQGGQTDVTWSMSGKKNLITKAMGLVMNMDNMIGRDFESGLATMKALSESSVQK